MNNRNSNIALLIFIWIASVTTAAFAQDSRTVETKVADVLALLPTKSNEDAHRLYRELMSLDAEALAVITARVLPNGKDEGIAPRFAVALLTHYATTKQDKSRIEKAYLAGLDKATDTEVKAYFIDNLKLVGSNTSIDKLVERINEEGLTNQAIGALESIGTGEARQALQTALENSKQPLVQARLILALGELKHRPALPVITGLVSSQDAAVKKTGTLDARADWRTRLLPCAVAKCATGEF